MRRTHANLYDDAVRTVRQLWCHSLQPHQRLLGLLYKWSSRAKAESVAMQTCAKYAKDCEVTVWYDRECGAVAADQGPTAFWGIGNTVSQARATALNECMKGGRKGCAVQVSQCSN